MAVTVDFFVVITLLPGDGASALDQAGNTLAVDADGTLRLSGVKIGTVAKVRLWSPDSVTNRAQAVFAPGKTDGKWWQWNSATMSWGVIDPLKALPGLLA